MTPKFSQLPLFNMKPTDEHRWPRGYTPERQAEVAGAVGSRVHATVDVPDSPGSNYRPRAEYEPPLDRPSVKNATGITTPEITARTKAVDNQRTAARHHIVDSLSRSSIPTEDMKSIELFRIDTAAENVAGMYHSHDKLITLKPQPNRVGLPGSVQDDRNLAHEVGHHADQMADPVAFNVRGKQNVKSSEWGPMASPPLEGAAEGYQLKHGMNQRRGEKPIPYTRTMAYQGFHDEPQFQNRFREVSGTRLNEVVPPPVSVRQYGFAERAAKENAGRQPHLFSRKASTEHTAIERDFGQYKLEADWMDRPEGVFQYPEIERMKMGGGVPHDVMREGFKRGDHMIIDDLKRNTGPRQRDRWQGGSYTAKDQRRVEGAWQRHYPGTDIGRSGA